MKLFQHVFKTILGIWEDEQLESIYNWVYYRGFLSFDDIYEQYCYDPEDIKKEEKYKVDGVKDCLNSNIIQKITLFTFHMSKERKCGMNILCDEFLQTLTRDQLLEFRDSIKSMPNSRPPPDEAYTPMTTFAGHTKPPVLSESQIALNNFKRGTKRDASAYPIFMNDLYYDTFQRSFLAIIKALGLYDVADPDFERDDGDQYEKSTIPRKTFFYLFCTGYFSSDRKGETVGQGI